MNRALLPVLIALGCLARPAGAEVTVTLDQFGVESMYRPGEYVGVRLKLTSEGEDEAIGVWVQWEVPNADGDLAEYGRSIPLTQGASRYVWLYAPLPPDVTAGALWTVRVFEERENRRRAELGGTRISAPATGVDIAASLIGVVGNNRMRLTDYDVATSGSPLPPASHETVRIVSGIDPLTMPDRWEGLKQFEAIAWADADPTELREETAEALVEYVRRGGHLVICLPEAGNPWGLGDPEQIELEVAALLPGRPRRDDDVPLSTLLPVLGKSRGLATNVDRTMSIHVFDDLEPPYEPLIKLPDGRTVVVQRTFGFGRVTVVGINVGSGTLNAIPLANGSQGLPQADVFWNRILGRRADTPTTGEVMALEGAELLETDGVFDTENALGSGRLIAERISMSRKAGIGLLLALVLFAAYWTVAGPGAFFVLKHLRREQHAWLAFAGAAALFTAVAWGAVSVIPQSDVTVRHVTFLDHIARPPDDKRADDPQMQRAVGWLSALLPDYRDIPVEIDSLPDQRDLLGSWKPPGMSVQAFPNVDRYQIDVARSPAAYAMPGRATATQLYANWMGGVDPDAWGGMLRVHPDAPIDVEIVDGREKGLRGAVFHTLPGSLDHVTVIWVKNHRFARRLYAQSGGQELPWLAKIRSGEMLNTGHMWRLSKAWDPNTALPLGDLDAGKHLIAGVMEKKYLDPYRDRTGGIAGAVGDLTEDNRRAYMEMLSFFGQLVPPKYLKTKTSDPSPAAVRFYRQLGRELDLSPWFTRPCLIIIGFLENTPVPYPIRLEGRVPESEGLTVIRWIYPLDLEESIAFPSGSMGASASGGFEPDEGS